MFCFATTLCAIDQMNHADGIEVNDEERGMPSSFELMNLESGDELVNPRYDILVNEFLFQLGVRIDYLRRLGDEMYFDRDPSTWDMRLLLYKLMRGIWLETTDGDPIWKMNKFNSFHHECGEQVCPCQNSAHNHNLSPLSSSVSGYPHTTIA